MKILQPVWHVVLIVLSEDLDDLPFGQVLPSCFLNHGLSFIIILIFLRWSLFYLGGILRLQAPGEAASRLLHLGGVRVLLKGFLLFLLVAVSMAK